jgi:uncharacterized SAM-binding protein YcdF (DUF218 family)
MKRIVFLFVVFFTFVAAVFAWPAADGRLVLQKMATELAMPYAIIWTGLALVCVLSWQGQTRWMRFLCLALLLLHTAAGNGLLSQCLALSLERPYENLQPLEEEPFDLIVVLGGGTTEARNGRAQASRYGDRIVLAARLYHAGLAKRIVCAGSNIAALSVGNLLTPAEEAAEFLKGLDVADEDIEQINGVNTMQEMENLANTIRPNERVGLITSAWHMNRALRLARSQGIRFVPLPADFITDYKITVTPLDLIPNSHAAADTRVLLSEYLARVVGR